MGPVESTRSRHMILDPTASEDAMLAGGHFAFPSMGFPTSVDGRRTFRYVTD